MLELLEPGVAIVANRLGDILAHTSGYRAVTGGTGLPDADRPNLNHYLSGTPRLSQNPALDLWHAFRMREGQSR